MMDERPLIVIADRSHQWNRGLRAELRRRGAEVLTTTHETDLVDLVTRFGPGLVILGEDLASDAGALLRTLAYRSPDTAFIVLGAAPEGVESAGFVHFVSSAVDPAGLLPVVESVFPGRLDEHPRPRVLCVDDDALFLAGLVRALRRHGYVVLPFDDPRRALASIDELHPDVAILDLRMPALTGLDLLEEIRRHYSRTIPVILLSGMTSEVDVAAAYGHGATRFLAKGGPASELVQVVHELAKPETKGVTP